MGTNRFSEVFRLLSDRRRGVFQDTCGSQHQTRLKTGFWAILAGPDAAGAVVSVDISDEVSIMALKRGPGGEARAERVKPEIGDWT